MPKRSVYKLYLVSEARLHFRTPNCGGPEKWTLDFFARTCTRRGHMPALEQYRQYGSYLGRSLMVSTANNLPGTAEKLRSSLLVSQPLQRQIIAAALTLIEDQERWSRGAIARTADRSACAWSDPNVVRFCALGALVRAAADLVGNEDHARELAVQAAREIAASSGRRGAVLPYINDCEGHLAVVRMFKKALS